MFCIPGAALHPVVEVACVLLWCGVGGLVVRWFDSIGGGGGCKKQKENQHPDGDKNCIGINLQKVFSHLNLFPLARRCTSIGICSVNDIFARRDVVEALLPLPFQTGPSVRRTDFSTTLWMAPGDCQMHRPWPMLGPEPPETLHPKGFCALIVLVATTAMAMSHRHAQRTQCTGCLCQNMLLQIHSD